jgi:glucokinase
MTEETNSRPRLVFAVDLGGTHLRVALVDEAGKIHAQLKQESPKGERPDCVVTALVAAAEKCGCKDQFAGSVIAASIVVPGAVDVNNAVVVQAPNLPALNNFGLKAALEEKFSWPVILENDANAAAVGEMWMGAARGFRDVISVTLGTGVGGGIILDGKLWRGAHGSAGEIGHTTVDPHGGLKCKCGNTGCLELFSSATAIVRMAKELRSSFPDSKLVEGQFTAEKIYRSGQEGDQLALEVFRRFGMYLGIGLANLINLIDPEVIVIAGGAVNGWSLFAGQMHQQVHERVFGTSVERVKIAPAECGDNAGLLGAARLAFDDDATARAK